jgi:hypothetical protein
MYRSVSANLHYLYLIKLSKWLLLIMPIVALFYNDNGLNSYDIYLLQAVYSFTAQPAGPNQFFNQRAPDRLCNRKKPHFHRADRFWDHTFRRIYYRRDNAASGSPDRHYNTWPQEEVLIETHSVLSATM